MPDSVDHKTHGERLDGHDDKLKEHEQMLAELKEADKMLSSEIMELKDKLDDGFSYVVSKVEKVHTEALASIPQTMANRLATHSLVWQVAATVALMFSAGIALIALFH